MRGEYVNLTEKSKVKSQRSKVKKTGLDPRRQTLDARRYLHGGNIYAFASALGATPDEVLDFSASINPLGMSPQARQAYRAVLRQAEHYPEPYAHSLTCALAHYHGLDPSQLVVSNGSTQLIYLLPRVLPARRVLLVAPLFSEHEAAFRATGASIARFLLRPPTFSLSLHRIAEALKSKRPDILVLTNPNSPTGTLIERAQMEELVHICQRLKTRLIVDETFIDWCEAESIKQLVIRRPHVLLLRSLTKFFALPGLRVGYAIVHPSIIQRVRARLEPWSVNVVGQEVGRICLQDQQFIERSRAFLPRERAWLSARLATIPYLRVFPSNANFLLVESTNPGFSASCLARQLAHERLLIRVCDNFVGLGKRFFRVAVRKRAENLRLVEALQSIFSERRCKSAL